MSKVIINNETGLAEQMPEQQALQALQQGTHKIPLFNPEGQPVNASLQEASDLVSQGFTQPTPEEHQQMLRIGKHGTGTEQLKAGAEAFARGVLPMGISTGIERLAGAQPEDIQARQEALNVLHPGAETAAELTGLVASTFIPGGQGKLLGAAGKVAEEAAVKALGSKAAAKIASKAAGAGVENLLFGMGDEAHKALMEDPNQSVASAIAHVGAAGLLGAGVGGALGAVPVAFDAMGGSKLGQFISDAKGRLQQLKETPDLPSAITDELKTHYGKMREYQNMVYGKSGLRQQELEQLLPKDLTPKMVEHNTEVINKIGDTLGAMQKAPEEFPVHITKELERQYKNVLEAGQSPQEVYNALNEFKRYAQASYRALKAPNMDSFKIDYRALNNIKDLGAVVRKSLESPVWGEAGERTAAINKAWSEMQMPFKDMNGFTKKIGDVREVDPDKVATFYNGVMSGKKEINQEMLNNYLKASERFEKAMAKTNQNLGLENPLSDVSTSALKSVTGKIPEGAKFIDNVLNKQLGKAAAAGIGASVGGAPGSIIGYHVLGGTLEKAVPALLRILAGGAEVSAKGARAAMDFSVAAAKGEAKLEAASKGIFTGSTDVKTPDSKILDKLDKHVTELKENPQKLLEQEHSMGEVYGDHAVVAANTTVRVAGYLASLKPNTAPQSPLDPPRKPNAVEQARYTEAMKVAQEPALVLKYIKEGSLTPDNIKDLHAMYPELATALQMKLMNHLTTAKAKNQQIPYKTKLSLSAFMGQPLESSMKPNAIMANQPQQAMAPNMGQPQHHRGTHNFTNLAKMPGSYETVQQSRVAHRIKGK